MFLSGLVYYISLLVCVSLGNYYKKINDAAMKRNYGTGLGILLVCLICGAKVIHSALMVWGNIIIIKCCDRRYMNQISLAFTWIYLLYLHIYVTNIYIIWLHQTLALKLVGLAFEMNENHTRSDAKGAGVSKLNLNDTENPSEPTATDIISYAYFFIGLHKGPYYRWKIFDDHFNAPFGVVGDCRIITEQKLKKALICGAGCLVLSMKYSPKFYYNDAFYKVYGADQRYLYNIPHLTIYFLYHQAIMMLCTSVFTETGFGMYPAKCHPIPGYGPSTKLSSLTLAAHSSPGVASEEEYNFSMIKCFNNEALLMGPKMKDTMRGWNMPTRYWFWAYVQKTCLKSNKEVKYSVRKSDMPSEQADFLGEQRCRDQSFPPQPDLRLQFVNRSAFALFVWTIWSGPTLPKFIIGCTLWVHVHLEAEYAILYDTAGSMKLPWDIGFSIMRLFCLLYLTPCFVIQNTSAVFRYYNSIFWVFHIILLVLMFLSIYIYKSRIGSE